MSERDFYSMPMVYDVLHTPGTADEVRGLAAIADRYSHHATQWLEPASGTGRYLRAAARLGVRAIGFDREPGMVAYAENAAAGITPTPRTYVAEMETCAEADGAPPAGSIGFAFCTINTIRHLSSDDAMLAHLDQIQRLLKPGGIYAVGVSLTVYDLEQPSEDVWEASRGRLRVCQTVNYVPQPDRIERVLSHLEITRPSGTEHVDSTYDLRSFSAEQWHGMIADAGWTVRAIVDEQCHPIEDLQLGYGIFVLAPHA